MALKYTPSISDQEKPFPIKSKYWHLVKGPAMLPAYAAISPIKTLTPREGKQKCLTTRLTWCIPPKYQKHAQSFKNTSKRC